MEKMIEEVLKKFDKAGFEVAIVGGAVRDILAKKEVSDWDLATSAKPDEILSLFEDAFYNNIYGTVGIPTDGEKVEITTYRSEDRYSDRRHPDRVKWGKTLEEDLTRRDFTINAMALKPKAKLLAISNFPFDSKLAQGEQFQISNFILIDPYDGQKDLKDKIIRAVGDADIRFNEDALRILRAIRFAATLGFEIEGKTLSAISKNSQLLSNISGERIREELFKIISSENAADGILLARETGILKEVLPELDECFTVEQKSPKRHHIYDVGTHCVMSMKFCPNVDVIARFATLLHDIGKAKVAKVTEEGVRTFYNHEVVGGKLVRQIASRLYLSKEQREKLFLLVRWHQFSVNENQTDRALRRFIKNIGVENIEDMMDLRIGDRLGGGLQQPESWRLKLFRQRLKEVLKKPFTVANLKVDGYDVMKILNIKPGPKVGEVLNTLFDEVEDDSKKNERKYLLKRLKQFK